MFIIIENHMRDDDVMPWCNLRGKFERMEEAQAMMKSLFLAQRERNTEDKPFDNECEDDEAHLSWECTPIRYDWYIFEV